MLPKGKAKGLTAIPKVLKGMEITVNSQLKQVSEPCSVSQLLDQLHQAGQKGIAVAVNSSVIPRNNWNDHHLKPYDQVLIIRAAQGG